MLGEAGSMGMGPSPISTGPRPWGKIPWRGPQWDRREGEDPELVYVAKIQIFNLSIPEDLKKYEQTTDKIANGAYMMGREEVAFDKDKGTWLVLLRWYEMYNEAPKGAPPRVEEKLNGKPDTW